MFLVCEFQSKVKEIMMKVALIQLMVVPEKKVNISRAIEKIRFAVDNGAVSNLFHYKTVLYN